MTATRASADTDVLDRVAEDLLHALERHCPDRSIGAIALDGGVLPETLRRFLRRDRTSCDLGMLVRLCHQEDIPIEIRIGKPRRRRST